MSIVGIVCAIKLVSKVDCRRDSDCQNDSADKTARVKSTPTTVGLVRNFNILTKLRTRLGWLAVVSVAVESVCLEFAVVVEGLLAAVELFVCLPSDGTDVWTAAGTVVAGSASATPNIIKHRTFILGISTR